LQPPVTIRPARPIQLAGPDAVEPAGRSIELTVSKSRLVRLTTEARDVIVGNPQIADVVVRTPTVVYVLGKSPGQTNVVFLDANGREVQSLDIKVGFDVDGLRAALRQA